MNVSQLLEEASRAAHEHTKDYCNMKHLVTTVTQCLQHSEKSHTHEDEQNTKI